MKTCFWLNVNPEMVPFPVDNANAILEKSKAHNQFLADESDNETTCEPNSFAKDDEFDEWAKTFEDCLSLIPGVTVLPLSHVICDAEQPQLLPHATNKENHILMASLTEKTFESNSEKVHTCLQPLSTKHSDALSTAKAVRMDARCGRSKWLALV